MTAQTTSSGGNGRIILQFPHTKSQLRKIEVHDSKGSYTLYRLIPCTLQWPAELVTDGPNPRSHKEDCLHSKVAKAIRETLVDNPEDFSLANRGGSLLADTLEFDPKREVVTIVLSDHELHGMADGATSNAMIAQVQLESRTHADLEVRQELAESLAKAQFNLEVVVGLTDHDRIMSLVRGRNTSIQVRPWSLDDFDHKFDWLKNRIDRKDGPYKGCIGWEENSGKDVSVLDVISVMTLFHSVYDDPADRRRKAPTVAFSSKGTAHSRFGDEKLAADYLALEPVMEDMLHLWEYIHANFEKTYEQWNDETHGRGSKLGRRKGVRPLKKSVRLPLTGIETEYMIEKGILFPLLASMRALLIKGDDGNLLWATDPIEFFDEFGTDLMDVLMSLYIDAAGKNPATLGKMKLAYTTLYDRARNLLRERSETVAG